MDDIKQSRRDIDIYIVDISLDATDQLFNNREGTRNRLAVVVRELIKLKGEPNKKICIALGRSLDRDGKELLEVHTGADAFAQESENNGFLDSSITILPARCINKAIALAKKPSTRNVYYYATPAIYQRMRHNFAAQMQTNNVANIHFATYATFLSERDSETKALSQAPQQLPLAISKVNKNKKAAGLALFLGFFALITLALVFSAPALPVISWFVENTGAFWGLCGFAFATTAIAGRQIQKINNVGSKVSGLTIGIGMFFGAVAIAGLVFFSGGTALIAVSGLYLFWQSSRAAKHRCMPNQVSSAESTVDAALQKSLSESGSRTKPQPQSPIVVVSSSTEVNNSPSPEVSIKG